MEGCCEHTDFYQIPCRLQDDPVKLLDETTVGSIRRELETLENEAMYVIALAKKELPWKEVDSTTEEQLTFLGLQAIRDPSLQPAHTPSLNSAIAAG